jgi:hypothetical protein
VDTTFPHNALCIQNVSKLNTPSKQVIAWKYPITSIDIAPQFELKTEALYSLRRRCLGLESNLK